MSDRFMLLKLKQLLLLSSFAYCCFLMVQICLLYFPWANDANFLVLKQDVVDTQPWRLAFQVHITTSSLTLIAGFTQFSRFFRQKKWQKVHRYSGYFYVASLLFFALPSGFILALNALGGITTQVAFILLSLFWGTTTILALYYALKKQWIKHRDWMIRSFALTLSAISLRTWKLALYEISPYWDWLTPLHIYQLESWLGWTINVLIAEIIILRLHHNSPKLSLR